ncbi:MAG: sugar phosphate isomerase/epimerase [Lachnospiraceae bacterium]|nr:sugar phosphate isomerase/epimerase [Lachnospiraceae bacterium]
MKVGTMTILFREQNKTPEQISHAESLRRIAAAGFESADLNLCLLAAHKTGLHLDNWKKEADEIIKAAEESHLSLPQCHLPFKSKKVKWQTSEELAYYNEMCFRAVDVASYIGIPWAVIHPERYQNSGFTSEQKRKKNIEYYASLVDYALSKNVNLAFENMRRQGNGEGYCFQAEELIELIDSYGDDRIGACWDTGHAHSCYADQYEPLLKLGPRLHCTHINDNLGGPGDHHLIPFSGAVNWESVMKALREINYSGDLILESFINRSTPNVLKDDMARAAYLAERYLLEV